MAPKTGIVWDERFLAHDTGQGHPECPQRLLAIQEVLKKHEGFYSLTSREATIEELSAIHSPLYIQTVLENCQAGFGFFDGDTPYSPGSCEAALLAVGGTLEAAFSIMNGTIQNAFSFVRPPGHHAEKNKAMGFCFFNNAALAAQYLIDQHNIKRVAIMDFDVHHGNGTQHAFYERGDVYYLSTHRFPFYPGTGAALERGHGLGLGTNLNVPLHAWADDQDYQRAFEEQIIPALQNFEPDFLIVSAGFDAHERDPLGGMQVTKAGFTMMAQNLRAIANKYCQDRLLYVLEGGYDFKGLQEGVEAVLCSLT